MDFYLLPIFRYLVDSIHSQILVTIAPPNFMYMYICEYTYVCTHTNRLGTFWKDLALYPSYWILMMGHP